MERYSVSDRNKVKRVPDRGHYDKETLFNILDSSRICHIGFSVDDQPFVIPTLFGRSGDKIYLHGATTSRLISKLQEGLPACMTVTHVDGLVLARSAFHHSMNYRSAVIFGKTRLVSDNKKDEALKIISDHIIPGRWEEVRIPNSKELKATSVLELNIEEASSKIRTGPPNDDKEDLELGIWAGVVPILSSYGVPEADEFVKDEGVPDSVVKLIT